MTFIFERKKVFAVSIKEKKEVAENEQIMPLGKHS